MNEEALRNDPDLQRILWACYAYWLTEPLPHAQRTVCHSWVNRMYEQRFGGTFHQSQLRRLADLGFLQPRDTARGGSRRYYAIVNPCRVAELLTEFGLIPSTLVAAQ